MVKPFAAFLIILMLLYASVRFDKLLFAPPMGDHAWAQCDRASVALNGIPVPQNGTKRWGMEISFFNPRTHNVANNPTGIAAGEFPAEPYFVSKLYQLFGFHEYIFRLCTFLMSLLGFIFAFLIAAKYLESPLLRFGSATLWLFSPNLIYFSTGFLPDNIALSFFVMGFYFLVRNKGAFSYNNLILFALCSTMAMLLKSSVAFLYGVVWLTLLLQTFKKQAIGKTLVLGASLLLPIAIAAAWILFAKASQTAYHSNVFRMNLFLPGSWAEFSEHINIFFHNLTKFYTPLGWLAILVLLFAFFRKLDLKDFISKIALGSLCAWALFTLLMFRNASHHGYYHVPFYFSIFLLTLAVFKKQEENWTFKTKKKHPHTFHSSLFTLHSSLIIMFLGANFFLFQKKIKSMAYHTELLNLDWYSAQPALRSLGIQPQDKVFSYPDKSYNNSLYLLNQRGWTGMPGFRTDYLETALKDCQYAVLGDTGIVDDPLLKGYFKERIGEWKGLVVYICKR